MGRQTPQGAVQCAYTEVPADQRTPQIKDVGLPANQQPNTGTQTRFGSFMIGGVILTAVGVGLAIFFTALITWHPAAAPG